MTYWFDQPVKVIESSTIEIDNIVFDPSSKKTTLPYNFIFKTIQPRHYKVVHNFLSSNYIHDSSNIIKLVYNQDFIYWYLKNMNNGIAIALIINKIIVGFITALFVKIKIDNKIIDIPYVNLLCVSKQLRNCNLCPILIDEIKTRICSKGLKHALFTSMSCPTKYFCKSNDYLIPINFNKLIDVGFINDIEHRNLITNNPLHLMHDSECNIIIDKLNNYYKNLKITIIFDYNSKFLLLSKKNIVYSFVNKTNNVVTDFVNFYKYYYYCIKQNRLISVAKLGFYFCEKLTPTELIEYLIDILPKYDIDQLCISDMANNDLINVTKYSTNGSLYCFLYNIYMSDCKSNQICLLPI